MQRLESYLTRHRRPAQTPGQGTMKTFGGTALAAAVLLAACSPVTNAVTGTLLDKAGQPLAGCDVRLGDDVGQSAEDGSFAVDPATGELRIECDGYAPKFITIGDGGQVLGGISLQRPNFILLLSDDQGWVQTSTQMDPDDPETRSDYFRTPNIDAFFSTGMRSSAVTRRAPTACPPGAASRSRSHP